MSIVPPRVFTSALEATTFVCLASLHTPAFAPEGDWNKKRVEHVGAPVLAQAVLLDFRVHTKEYLERPQSLSWMKIQRRSPEVVTSPGSKTIALKRVRR